jgi:hypothetical protein
VELIGILSKISEGIVTLLFIVELWTSKRFPVTFDHKLYAETVLIRNVRLSACQDRIEGSSSTPQESIDYIDMIVLCCGILFYVFVSIVYCSMIQN